MDEIKMTNIHTCRGEKNAYGPNVPAGSSG